MGSVSTALPSRSKRARAEACYLRHIADNRSPVSKWCVQGSRVLIRKTEGLSSTSPCGKAAMSDGRTKHLEVKAGFQVPVAVCLSRDCSFGNGWPVNKFQSAKTRGNKSASAVM